MSDETANQLRAWAASGLTKNLFSGATPLCDTLAQAAAHIEALQAQLAESRAGLEKLQNAAGEVSRQGAVTGPQWTRLNIALLSARATLAKIGGGE